MLLSQAAVLPLAAVEPVIGRAFTIGPAAQQRDRHGIINDGGQYDLGIN